MKIYKNTFLLFLIASLSFCELQAQKFNKNDSTNLFNRNSSLIYNKRLGFSVDFGFGFAAGSNNNSGTYTYVAPYLSYMVTPKFKLDVGGIISKGFNSFYNYQTTAISSNNTNYFLFARGNYLLTDRLTISGAFYKSFSPNNSLISENKNKNILNNAGMSLGVDYKINDHMIIGAQVSVSNGSAGNYFMQSNAGHFGGFSQNRCGNGFMGW